MKYLLSQKFSKFLSVIIDLPVISTFQFLCKTPLFLGTEGRINFFVKNICFGALVGQSQCFYSGSLATRIACFGNSTPLEINPYVKLSIFWEQKSEKKFLKLFLSEMAPAEHRE